MSNVVTPLTRVFKMNSVRLPDPDPGESDPLAALHLYDRAYPHLKQAVLLPPVVEGDELVFEVEKPPVKTKG